MDSISRADFRAALKQYRTNFPSVGTVNEETINKLLAEGRTCRGWTTAEGRPQYFHIIKMSRNYPEKSVFFGDTELELFEVTLHLGMEHGIDLNDLLSK